MLKFFYDMFFIVFEIGNYFLIFYKKVLLGLKLKDFRKKKKIE